MRLVLGLAPLRRLLVVVGVAFAALPVGSAFADTTIGRDGGDPAGCPGTLVVADINYKVPGGNWTITKFGFRPGPSLGQNTQQADFLALESLGEGAYVVIGHTGLVTMKGPGLQTFDANIPVQGGDIIGLWHPAGFVSCVRSVPRGGGVIPSGPLSDPTVPQLVTLSPVFDSFELNESARLVTRSGSPPPPAPLPTSKAQCTNGGWQSFGFKNQGDCVSFVASGGKNPPSGS